MQRIHAAGCLVLAVLALGAAPLDAGQEWSPPSRQMPQMPSAGELDGGWKGSLGGWFNGTGVPLDQVRASGEGGGARPHFVRFTGQMRPVEAWSDRNGDGRADLIEVFRDGATAYQLVDADYDGRANVLRVYGSSGALAREERY
jgi:hypothetical protein